MSKQQEQKDSQQRKRRLTRGQKIAIIVPLAAALVAGIFTLIKKSSGGMSQSKSPGSAQVGNNSGSVSILTAGRDAIQMPTTIIVSDSPNAIVQNMQNSSNSTQSVTVIHGDKKRQISQEQQMKMKDILAPFAGSEMRIWSDSADSEAMKFCDSLAMVFKAARWRTGYGHGMFSGPIPPICLKIPTNEVSQAGREMLNSLGKIHSSELPAKDVAVLDALAVLGMDCPISTSLIRLPHDELLTNVIEITIGSLPPSP